MPRGFAEAQNDGFEKSKIFQTTCIDLFGQMVYNIRCVEKNLGQDCRAAASFHRGRAVIN